MSQGGQEPPSGRSDLVLYGSPVQLRPGRQVRRGSSLAKAPEDAGGEEGGPRPEGSDKFRKSIDGTYRLSLESISEHRPRSASLCPSTEFGADSAVSDGSSDWAVRSAESANDTSTDRTCANSTSSYMSWIESVGECGAGSVADSDAHDKSGEWHNFWTSYNSSRNEYFSSPYLCPSNSGENLSVGSNCSTHRAHTDRSHGDVTFTLDEVNEALHHTERLLDILKSALLRSEHENEARQDADNRYGRSRDDKYFFKTEKVEKSKSGSKSAGVNSCINILLGQTGVADILKRVISKRREVIMPQEDSSSKNSVTEWPAFTISRDQ